MGDWTDLTDTLGDYVTSAWTWLKDNPGLSAALGSELVGLPFGILDMQQRNRLMNQALQATSASGIRRMMPQMTDAERAALTRQVQAAMNIRGLQSGGAPGRLAAQAFAEDWRNRWALGQQAAATRAANLMGLMSPSAWNPGSTLAQFLMLQELQNPARPASTPPRSLGVRPGEYDPYGWGGQPPGWTPPTLTLQGLVGEAVPVGPQILDPQLDWDAVSDAHTRNYYNAAVDRGTLGGF